MTATASPPGLRVAGAAAPWVADLLEGVTAPARVLHSGRDAVYLDVRGRCVGVLSSGAALVPCGVRTSLTALPTVAAGTDVTVGRGSVELPGCRVEVAGTVATVVGGLSRDGVGRAGLRAALLTARNDERLEAVRAALPDDALHALAAGRPTSTTRLLGRGPGLTPLGDDVLSGWLVAAAVAGDPAVDGVRDAVQAQAARTTLLSATLLSCAARGEALPEVREFIRALAGPPPERVERALEVLLAVGGTSGAGLALGCLLALRPDGAEPARAGAR